MSWGWFSSVIEKSSKFVEDLTKAVEVEETALNQPPEENSSSSSPFKLYRTEDEAQQEGSEDGKEVSPEEPPKPRDYDPNDLIDVSFKYIEGFWQNTSKIIAEKANELQQTVNSSQDLEELKRTAQQFASNSVSKGLGILEQVGQSAVSIVQPIHSHSHAEPHAHSHSESDDHGHSHSHDHGHGHDDHGHSHSHEHDDQCQHKYNDDRKHDDHSDHDHDDDHNEETQKEPELKDEPEPESEPEPEPEPEKEPEVEEPVVEAVTITLPSFTKKALQEFFEDFLGHLHYQNLDQLSTQCILKLSELQRTVDDADKISQLNDNIEEIKNVLESDSKIELPKNLELSPKITALQSRITALRAEILANSKQIVASFEQITQKLPQVEEKVAIDAVLEFFQQAYFKNLQSIAEYTSKSIEFVVKSVESFASENSNASETVGELPDLQKSLLYSQFLKASIDQFSDEISKISHNFVNTIKSIHTLARPSLQHLSASSLSSIEAKDKSLKNTIYMEAGDMISKIEETKELLPNVLSWIYLSSSPSLVSE